jgi:soluble lytic murein transglycosylase-like protein
LAALRLHFGLALVALGLASTVAWVEHQARQAAAQAKPGDFLPTADAPASVAATSEALAPRLDLLDKVKNRAPGKPAFDKKADAYEALILKAAQEHEVSPALVKAVIQAESTFNASAVSSQGAVGLMQVLPSTARSMGFTSPHEPGQNIRAGVRYLKTLLREFGDDEYLALAAYNCGPDAIRRYGNQMPPFSQTRSFVAKVMEYYRSNIDT